MLKGWDWMDCVISSKLVNMSNDSQKALVKIDFTESDGVDGSYEVTVENDGSVVMAECLNGENAGESTQYAVRQFVKVG